MLSTHPSALQQRIFYQFQNSSIQAAVYSRIRAAIITDPPAGQPLNHDWLTDKIVIIGSSNEAARDIHPTPLGEMPGALVLINQINALLHYGQFLEVETWLKWPILIGLIIVFSMSFSFFTIVWGTRIARFVVNAMLVPLSLWLFQYGWWLDIVLPLIAIQLHRTIEELSGISDTLPPEVKDEAKAKSRPA